MAKQSELEKLALQARAENVTRNTYNGDSDDKKYSATHTRALADNKTPEHGKGLGNGTYLDTNGDAGSATDIFGNPDYVGSGRNKSLASNQYTKSKWYETPDTTKNIGQINF